MKNHNCLIAALILFAIGISACKKKQLEYGTLPEPNGLVSATINGQPWSTSFNTSRYSIENPDLFGIGSDIYVNGFKAQFFGLADIALDKPFQNVYSIYASHISPVPWAMFSTVDADAVLDRYTVVDSSDSNFITVDAYDPGTGKVKGRFNVVMYKDFGDTLASDFGDTIRVTDGTYELTLSYAP